MSETIIEKTVSEGQISDFQRYAWYVTFSRILSDIRDGLKPVQRRVIFDMYKYLKAYNGHRVKTASVVGNTMQHLHAHGDSSVAGSIKTLTNSFECKVPLIDHQGSFGDFNGNEAAAPRYTEVCLSNFAYDCVIGELSETSKATDWIPNYDNTSMEPEYLPVKVPLLLINGSMGIGVGIKSEIPAHNINEVIDATIALIDNPEAEITLVPDHCQGGYIANTDFKSIGEKGFGYYTYRSVVDIEDYKGKKALVIKTVHDLLYLDNIIESIEKLIASKKLIQIDNCYDESTLGKNPGDPDIMRYVIVLKNGSDPEYVREVLYKNTALQDKLRINLQTIYGLEPLRVSYRAYLLSFIEFRKITKFRVYTNLLQEVQTKSHEMDAFIKVLQSGEIDNIIDKIKSQKSIDDTALVEYLIKKLNITDIQAGYIINANLKKLSLGYLNKYIQEFTKLNSDAKVILSKISNEAIIEAEIRQELLDIKAKYGQPRKCKIINLKNQDEVPAGLMQVVLTEKNFIKKVPMNNFLGNFRNDRIKQVITIDNRDTLLIFDNFGRVMKIPIAKIPFSDKNSNGIELRYLIKGFNATGITMLSEDLIKDRMKFNDGPRQNYIVTISKFGLVKRMNLSDFTCVPNSGLIYSKVDEGDYVHSVYLMNNELDLILYSDRKAVRLSISDISEFKRNTKGSRAMNAEEGIDGVCTINAGTSHIIVVTERGKINKISTLALPANSKTKGGFNIIKLSADDKIKQVISCNYSSVALNIITPEGTNSIPVEEIPDGSSISAGKKMIPKTSNFICAII